MGVFVRQSGIWVPALIGGDQLPTIEAELIGSQTGSPSGSNVRSMAYRQTIAACTVTELGVKRVSETNQADGVPKRAIIANNDLSEYMGVTDWTTDPWPEDWTRFPLLEPAVLEAGQYFVGYESNPGDSTLTNTPRASGARSYTGVMSDPDSFTGNERFLSGGDASNWSLVDHSPSSGNQSNRATHIELWGVIPE
jgi:hypothetical protein